MGMRIQKTVVASGLAALIMVIALFAGAAPANAVGGNCTAQLLKYERIGLDEFQAGAMCYSLQGDSKARPKLIRNGGPDYTGSWFTRLNVYYYTNAYTCYAGCSAAYEITHI
jgi:hypothetical protein